MLFVLGIHSSGNWPQIMWVLIHLLFAVWGSHPAWQQGVQRRWLLWWALNKAPGPLLCSFPTHLRGVLATPGIPGMARDSQVFTLACLAPSQLATAFQPRWGLTTAATCETGKKNLNFVVVTQHWSLNSAGVSGIPFFARMNEFSRCPINNMETNENLWSHKSPLVSPGQVFMIAGCNAATFWLAAEKA